MTEFNYTAEVVIAPESPSTLPAVRGTLGGFTGRISSSLKAGYEAICEVPQSLKTYAAVGATAITLFTLASAETATADTNSVASEGNVPGLTGSTLLSDAMEMSASSTIATSSLEQECVKAGLAAPKILSWPTMVHAGMHSEPTHRAQHHPGQALEGLFQYPALEPPLTSANCTPDYLRQVGGKFFMEKADVRGNPGNPIKNPSNWTSVASGWWMAAIVGAPGKFSRNQNEAATVHVRWATSLIAPQFFNQCIDGKFLKVEYVGRNTVTDGQTGQQLAETYHIYNSKIQGNCKAAAKSARIAANEAH